MRNRPLLFVLLIAAAFVTEGARAQSALVISQYVDTNTGTAPKGIELWNVSGTPIDFADHTLVVTQYTNGKNFGQGIEKATVTSGTLAPGAVMVIGRDTLKSRMSATHSGVLFIDASFTFNGNDALAIELDGAIEDVFGTVGDNPGSAWKAGGVSSADQNIQLIDGISDGDADGWADPSTRFEVVSTDPLGDGGLAGFGEAPSGTTTTIQFATDAATTPEGDSGTSTYHLSVTVSNPDDNIATEATVVVAGGIIDEGDDYSFSDTPLVFPAGSNEPQTVSVMIHGDIEPDGSKTIIFELRDVTGGDDAGVGAPSTFELTIQNDDVPPLLITEIAQDPDSVGDSDGEWFEVFSAADIDINMEGWTIRDAGSNEYEISAPVIVPASEFAVFCKNDDTGTNGGFSCDHEFTGTLANTDDEIVLVDDGGTVIDSVAYDGGASWPDPTGASMVFTGGPAGDNNDGSSWIIADSREASYSGATGDFGSPGTEGTQQNLLSNAEQVLTISGTPGTGNDAGWRMLSAPVEGATRDGLGDDVDFGVDSGSMFYTWDEDDWIPGSGSTSLTSGRGFILYLFDDDIDPIDDELRLDLPGTPPSGDVAVSNLEIDETWHLLGNPYGQSYDLTGLALAEKGFQAVVQVWNPETQSYELKSEVGGSTVDAVAAWQGFFVQRSQAGSESTQIEFDATFRTTGAGFFDKRGRSAAYRSLQLRAVGLDAAGDEVARDEAATLFFHPDATSRWDAYDAAVANAPPRQTSVRLAFAAEHGNEIVAKAQESRPYLPDEALAVDLTLEAENVEGDLMLEWPAWDNLPDGWSLTLIDRATDATVDLRSDDRYVFRQAAHDGPRFALVVDPSTTTSTEAPALPDRLTFHPPHPNPARTHVTLRYGMPEAAAVQLRLYDVLGREVASMHEGREPAGMQSIDWTLPSHLASGLYIVRLDAAGQSLARRLILSR